MERRREKRKKKNEKKKTSKKIFPSQTAAPLTLTFNPQKAPSWLSSVNPSAEPELSNLQL